jgi:prephenate dehydrogenase
MRDTVAIIGVGLIGGSIGLALRRRGLAKNVVGIGRSEQRLQIALERGAVTRFTTDVGNGVADADLIVVCTPVGRIVADVQQASRASRACPPHALITDAGSTKGAICRALSAGLPGVGVFVGSHPMAGSERGGVEFAEPDLFDGCVTVVTPTEQTPEEHVTAIKAFWTSLGSRVVRATPEEHDRAVADVSHVPHLVAAALAAATDGQFLPLAASGWRDTTRVAAGDPELWQQIFSENRGHVLQSLAAFEKVLSSFRKALEDKNTAEMVRILEAGKEKRDTLGS